MFTDNPLSTELRSHSDKNSSAVNNRYRISSNAITLANDNHIGKYLKEILVFVYYGWIVNNRSKNCWQLKLILLEHIQL